MTAECDHTREVPGYWAPNPDHDPVEWDLGGYDLGPDEWIGESTETLFEPIDFYHEKCSRCGFTRQKRRY